MMKKIIVLLSVVGFLSVFANAGEIKVSQLAVLAEKIGADWSGPTGLVVDDIDAPPTLGKDMADVIAGLQKQMKPLGVKGTADFTYRKKSDPVQQVTLRVFAFKTEEQCKQWMKTKYQFPGWEKKYKKIEDKDLTGFDSLEMRKRIVAVGALWITAGTIAENDDHLKILGLLLEQIKQQKPQAEPTSAGDVLKAAPEK